MKSWTMATTELFLKKKLSKKVSQCSVKNFGKFQGLHPWWRLELTFTMSIFLGIFQNFSEKIFWTASINPFQPSVAFHIEASHLFCSAKQMTGFYIKQNTWLKWLKSFLYRDYISQKMLSHGCLPGVLSDKNLVHISVIKNNNIIVQYIS